MTYRTGIKHIKTAKMNDVDCDVDHQWRSPIMSLINLLLIVVRKYMNIARP